jgi:phenylalanyl-tRNA synthetase beta chain
MEYSLQTLYQNSNLNNLRINEIINKLNLIGFEVDEIFFEKAIENKFLDNIRLLIKIPANREDLLNETFFLTELATILNFESKNTWKQIKKNYFFILKKKYFENYNYQSFEINSSPLEMISFNIQIQNCTNFASPLWIQKKLKNFGIVPQKNLRDLVELANIEFGQNFNSFSYHVNEEKNIKLSEPLDLRFSNFFFVTLTIPETFLDRNNVSYVLPIGTIVMKDKNNQILTVLGLINPLISEQFLATKEIFLQSIFYNIEPNTLGSKNFSLRYFRKIFLEMFKRSFQRLLTLLEINSSISISPKTFLYVGKSIILKENKILRCRQSLFKFFLNLENYNLSTFKKSGLKIICKTKDALYFSIPNYRTDLKREIDLIEEYTRFSGYQNLDQIFPKKEQKILKENITSFIKDFFISYGFNEVITNPILDINKQVVTSLGIKNPLNNEFAILRTSLLLKLIEIFENNLRLEFEKKNFFEIGRTFKKENNKIIESDKLAGIFQLERIKKGPTINIEWFIAKGFLEKFLSLFNHKNLIIEQNNKKLSFFHEKKSILIKIDDRTIGIFGEISPKLENYKTYKYSTFLFELDLSFFKNWRKKSLIPVYQEYSRYPSITKDLSLTVIKKINLVDLKNQIQGTSKSLKRIEFFDLYFDEKNTNIFKIGIRLEFQSNSQTFTSQQIDEEMKAIDQLFLKNFKNQII